MPARGATSTSILQRPLADAVDHPGPAQTVFFSLAGIDVLLRYGWPLQVDDGARAALVLLLVATAAVFVLPWSRLPRWATAVVAVADLGVIGLIRIDEPSTFTTVLLVLPALYLGRHHGGRGVGLTALACAGLVVAPTLLVGEPDGGTVSRVLLGSVVAIIAAAAFWSAVRRLQAQQRTFDAIVDGVAVGLVLVDPQGRYHSINATQERLMRVAFPETEDDEERDRGTGRVYAADGVTLLPAEQWPSARVGRGEEFDDVRIWVGDDPLTRRAISVSARVVRGERGEFEGGSLACHDITDFLRAADVKDGFVSSVSHELRTPLTSINGYTLLLLDRDDLPPQARAHLEVVARNSDRLNRLVADLLHAAQQDHGQNPISRSACDLAGVVREAVESAAPVAAQREVALHLHSPWALPAVVDRQRMAQVVDNLVSNALKYTPAGGTVEVSLVLDGDRAEFVVRDTGIGIEPTDRDRLFSRFYRARSADDQAVPGVGLGLSIVRDIVVAHGGRIEVESEPGAGSLFRVRLPLSAPTPIPSS